MLYFDTSVLGALFLNEPQSGDVISWMALQEPGNFAVSSWVLAEMPSMLGRRVRNALYTAEQAHIVHARISAWLENHCLTESVQELDFRRAATYQLNWHLGLRAGDALHLAICDRLGIVMVTLDRKLVEAAGILNIPVIDPSTPPQEIN
jgi:uncharacterized protein